MLDLGAQFCTSTPRCDGCPVARCVGDTTAADPAPRSAGVSRPQPPFEGSDRQLRGRVLEALRAGPSARGDSCVRGGDARAAPHGRRLIADGLVEAGTTRATQRRRNAGTHGPRGAPVG